jgi:Fic-DOC domain mobile mystery protein B
MGLKLTYGEGQTPIDQDELDQLKVKTISVREELDEFEQQNIEKAQEWLLGKNFTAAKILSEDFLFELHERMFGDVWSWAGQTRRTNKNIGVDWKEIRIHLRQLLEDTKYWIEHRTYSEDEIAIRFKYRIVNIHCFPNGNGRHSRLMADIIIEKIFAKPLFTWGKGSITTKGEVRSNYLTALKQADPISVDALIAFARS